MPVLYASVSILTAASWVLASVPYGRIIFQQKILLRRLHSTIFTAVGEREREGRKTGEKESDRENDTERECQRERERERQMERRGGGQSYMYM